MRIEAPTTTPLSQRKQGSLHPDLTAAVHALCGALTEMLTEVGADVSRPQEVSRKLLLDKSLSWKLSRIVGATEVHEALQHLPGDAAVRILIRAVERAGGSAKLRQKTQQMIGSLQETVRARIGDKATLELVVDALPDETGERLSVSRKLAFRGNSAIWGVQARVRFNTIMLRPNAADPEMIDSALVAGWVDFRRLRHDAKWTVFRRHSFSDQQNKLADAPIDPAEPVDGPMFLRKFCSPNMPQIESVVQDGMRLDELGASEVGNSGMFTYVFGSVVRALGSRYGPEGATVTFVANVSAPAEHLQFDMLVHRDCGFALKQQVRTLAKLTVLDTPPQDSDVLPIQVMSRDLGRFPPVVTSPLMASYGEIIADAARMLGWDLGEFSGTRHLMGYPPFPSTVVVSSALDRR